MYDMSVNGTMFRPLTSDEAAIEADRETIFGAKLGRDHERATCGLGGLSFQFWT